MSIPCAEQMQPEELKRERRRRLRMTQVELGNAIDVHPNTIAKWERGEQPIQHSKMLRLALQALKPLDKPEPLEDE
jgi:transcriptional regulator with XRE-family HTH domain